jgi:porin
VRGAEQSGTKFNTNTGALFIGEVQFALNGAPSAAASQSPQQAAGGPAPGLPGTYKIGFWYDTGAFPDQRFDATGLSLANPASTGDARMRRHNFSGYAVMDQTVWRPDPNGARAVGIFARLAGAPGDRNVVDRSLNAGVTLKAPFPGRDNDTVGLGYGYAHISASAAALAQDTARFTAGFVPKRGSENFIELTYQAQLAPWWIVQPDLQYVFMPSGGIANPLNPSTRIKNELVLGLRTNLTF